MLHFLSLSPGFGAPISGATCASSDEVNAVSALVQETKAEATAAKAQASVAPQGSADYPGLFALAENSSTIHLIAGMKKMGLVVPSDWECQSQARTGVYPCPDGEPSECRYYQDATLANMGECVYWYCTKDPRSAGDGCCNYYDGRIGTSIANTNLTFTDGSKQTFAAYAETSGAAATCSATADQLHAYLWHQYWYNDNSVQSNGQLVVTTAYINFDIVRLEFSHKYGLSLYSTNQDILKIEKDGSASCSGTAAPNSCYTTYFQPIQSSTVIYLQNGGLGPTEPMGFSLDESELYNSPPAAPPAAGRRMEEGGDAPTAKPNPVTVQDVEEMNRATRFIASCDGNKPGCSGGKKFASGSHTPPLARHGRKLRRGGGGSFSGDVHFTMFSGGANNRAGNRR